MGVCDGWGKGEVVGSERPALGVCGRCGVRRSGDAEVCDCGEQGMGGELGRDPRGVIGESAAGKWLLHAATSQGAKASCSMGSGERHGKDEESGSVGGREAGEEGAAEGDARTEGCGDAVGERVLAGSGEGGGGEDGAGVVACVTPK